CRFTSSSRRGITNGSSCPIPCSRAERFATTPPTRTGACNGRWRSSRRTIWPWSARRSETACWHGPASCPSRHRMFMFRNGPMTNGYWRSRPGRRPRTMKTSTTMRWRTSAAAWRKLDEATLSPKPVCSRRSARRERAIHSGRAPRLDGSFVIQLRQHVVDLLPALVADGDLFFDFFDNLLQSVFLRVQRANEALAEVLLRRPV